jgi:hypothetical protein
VNAPEPQIFRLKKKQVLGLALSDPGNLQQGSTLRFEGH